MLNIKQIQEIIPHRPPFLLVDKIVEIEDGKRAVGIKNVTINEPFFVGHFPEYAVMPGVLIVEALAQVGAVAILNVESNRGKLGFLAGIDGFRFRGQVVPGDTLRLEVEIIRLKGMIGKGKATATVDGRVVAGEKLCLLSRTRSNFQTILVWMRKGDFFMSEMSQRTIDTVQRWLNDPYVDEETKQELRSLEHDAKELEERFYRDLEFGTGGLRGVIGAGSNRMNKYTVGRATQGFAQYILEAHGEAEGKPSVVIAHDSRHFSPEFALEAALVLAGNGIVAKLYPSLRSTPQLSFSVRHLDATGGIVVTASHNPPEYNGYKVYNREGGQLVPDEAENVIARIQEVDSFSAVKRLSQADAEAQGLLVWLGEAEDQAFVDTVTDVSVNRELIASKLGEDFKIVFTPLHGTGQAPVERVLRNIGFKHIHVVPEQAQPDGNFSTVKSPNPEEREAFTLAMKLGEEVGADILIGTDPDADRMGAVVKNGQGEYVVLTGNQSGAIMIHYLLGQLKGSGQAAP